MLRVHDSSRGKITDYWRVMIGRKTMYCHHSMVTAKRH